MASGLLDPSWAPAAHPAAPRHDEPERAPDDGAMSPATVLSGGSSNVRGGGGGGGGGGGDGGRAPRKLVLCFDGTGNKFHGDESDSNILKIFRMLDRTAGDQYHYYQPGIGTYVVSGSLTHTGFRARLKSWYTKAKDSAVGSSFDQHVVGGYRFLMRFYNPGDEIFMFGFSRGAYIARFLAEMLDHVGLLSHGNEEMVKFAWKAFAQWQSRRQSSVSEAAAAAADDDDDDDGDKEGRDDKAREAARQARKMYSYMKGFRETFSRPVGRIRFLGLFDTVNSVPRFETAWMQRSKFPYTARSSARVIRHAVSIDERRAKFRQDLMYQSQSAPTAAHRHHHRHSRHVEQFLEPFRRSLDLGRPHSTHRPHTSSTAAREKDGHLSAGDAPGTQPRLPSNQSPYTPYRPRSRSRRMSVVEEVDAMSCASGRGPTSDAGPADYEDDGEQDVDEVWFAGGHGDVGGGWEALDGRKSASHVPLAWIVREAVKAGLSFDMDKVEELGCMWDAGQQYRDARQGAKMGRPSPVAAQKPDIRVLDENNGVRAGPPAGQSSPETDGHEFVQGNGCGHTSHFHDLMHRAHTSRIHDSLVYGGGLGTMAVAAWNLMEFLPFRRMDMQADGSWKPIRWPLPRGEVRDIPPNVRVHGSVIRRLKADETYRPGNLIIGGGGRGVKRAPAEYGIGEWVCVAEHGDPIGEVWTKKEKPAVSNGH